MSRSRRRAVKWIELERLRADIKAAELKEGTTLAADDIRLTGKLPALELPKVSPAYEKATS